MKKLILLFGLLFCLCSCTMDMTVYECNISYTINGSPVTETFQLDMSSSCVPSYRLDQKSLTIIGSSGSSSLIYKTIYRGSLDVKVKEFDYKIVRSYKASQLDGHELKRK